MGTAFKLNGGLLFISTEAPGGVYNAAQLKKIAQIAEQNSIVIKTTEDQRLALMVPLSKVPKVATELKSVGLGMRHYQDGLHQPVNCAGEFCSEKNQDAMATSIQLTKDLSRCGALGSKLKIGINGCGACCVPTHTLDISIIGEVSGYRISLGGKNSQIPEMAIFMAEGIPAEKVSGLVVQIVECYKKLSQKGESLQDVMERCGTGDFIKILAPYSQDAHQSEANQESTSEGRDEDGGPVLEQDEDMSYAEPTVGDLSERSHDSGPSIDLENSEAGFNDPSVEALDEDLLVEEPTLGSDREVALNTSLEAEITDESIDQQNLSDVPPPQENSPDEILLEEPLGDEDTIKQSLTDESIPEDPLSDDLKLEQTLGEEVLSNDLGQEISLVDENLNDELSSSQDLTGEDLSDGSLTEEDLNAPNLNQGLASSSSDDMLSVEDLSLMDENLSTGEMPPQVQDAENSHEGSELRDPLEVSSEGSQTLEDQNLSAGEVDISPQPDNDASVSEETLSEIEETENLELSLEDKTLTEEKLAADSSDLGPVGEVDPSDESELHGTTLENSESEIIPEISLSGDGVEEELSDENMMGGSETHGNALSEAEVVETNSNEEVPLSSDEVLNEEKSEMATNESLEASQDPAALAEEVSENEADDFEQKLVASIEEEESVPELEDSNREDRQAVMHLVELSQSYPREQELDEALAAPKDFSDLGIEQDHGQHDELSSEVSGDPKASANNENDQSSLPSPTETDQQTSTNQDAPLSPVRKPPTLSVVPSTGVDLELEGLDLEDSGRVVISFNTGSKFFFDCRNLKLGKTQKLRFRGKLLSVSRDETGLTVEVDGLSMTVPASEVA